MVLAWLRAAWESWRKMGFDLWMEKGKACMDRNEFSEAAQWFWNASRVFPGSAQAWRFYALALLEAGEFERVLAAADQIRQMGVGLAPQEVVEVELEAGVGSEAWGRVRRALARVIVWDTAWVEMFVREKRLGREELGVELVR